MSTFWNRFQEFPQNHEVITPSNSADLPREMLVMAGSDGAIALRDRKGTDITYTVTAGTILPVLGKRVLATGTTVSPVIGLY